MSRSETAGLAAFYRVPFAADAHNSGPFVKLCSWCGASCGVSSVPNSSSICGLCSMDFAAERADTDRRDWARFDDEFEVQE